jgi:hypothetical protein
MYLLITLYFLQPLLFLVITSQTNLMSDIGLRKQEDLLCGLVRSSHVNFQAFW